MVQKAMCTVVGGYVCVVQVALFVVHPREGAAVGVVHQGSRLPVNSVGAVLKQDVTEVDEGELGKAEHRGNPPIRIRHPCGRPAQLVVEPEQVSSVLWVEPDLQGPLTEREYSVFLGGPLSWGTLRVV